MTMGENPRRLPERTFYSVEDIAQQWGCDVDLVLHYVVEGLLRLSIRDVDLNGLAMFGIDEATALEEKEGRSFWGLHWSKPDAMLASETVWASHLMDIPKFLYINLDYVAGFGFQCVVSVVEDYDRKEYGLIDMSEPSRPAKLDISRLVSREHTKYRVSTCPYFGWNPSELTISRNERDRFEQEHGLAGSSVDPQSNYATPYLDVMHLAIAEFFSPRHPVDAKREEVEDWIAERLEAAGTEGSKRIASAMFTIIKPSDHNPRKRRG